MQDMNDAARSQFGTVSEKSVTKFGSDYQITAGGKDILDYEEELDGIPIHDIATVSSGHDRQIRRRRKRKLKTPPACRGLVLGGCGRDWEEDFANLEFLHNRTPSSSSDAVPTSDAPVAVALVLDCSESEENTETADSIDDDLLLRLYFAEQLKDFIVGNCAATGSTAVVAVEGKREHTSLYLTGGAPESETQECNSGTGGKSMWGRALLESVLFSSSRRQASNVVHAEESGNLEPGSVADFKRKYEIQRGKMKGIEDLGEGAFGSVMRCVHKESKAKRAVKIGDNEDKRSNQIWKRLGRHPHIVELVYHVLFQILH